MPAISKFADNAKNAIEQKDIKLTWETAVKRFLQDGGVGGKWRMSFYVGKCAEWHSGDTQEKHGSLLALRGTTQERRFQIIGNYYLNIYILTSLS